MGNDVSKNSHNNIIDNYQNIKLPHDHKIIKIANITTNLKRGFSLNLNVKKIMNLIFSSENNMDIISIQGLKDKYAIYQFVNLFKQRNNNLYYIAPYLEDDIITSITSASMSGTSPRNSPFNRRNHHSLSPTSLVSNNSSLNIDDAEICRKSSKLILSKFPIQQTFIENIIIDDVDKLYENINYDNFLVGANIKIGKHLYAIYNFMLIPDMIYINTHDIRKKQLQKIKNIINSNTVDNDINLNIVTAKLNIYTFKFHEYNIEYLNLLNEFNLIDTQLIINTFKNKYNNSYIMFYINDEYKLMSFNDIRKSINKDYDLNIIHNDIDDNDIYTRVYIYIMDYMDSTNDYS